MAMGWLERSLVVALGAGMIPACFLFWLGVGDAAPLFALAVSLMVFLRRAMRSRDVPNQATEVDTVFCETYEAARTRFRCVCNRAGAKYEELPVSNGLTTAVAFFEGDERKLFVHVSGTHGVDGHAGNAIQLQFIEEIVTRGGWTATGPSLVFVHLLNPFGFKHGRFFNENNVDLNRNNLSEKGWEEAHLRSQGKTHIPDKYPDASKDKRDYDSLSSFLNPSEPVKIGRFSEACYWAKYIYQSFKLKSPAVLRKAILQGQFHNPKGLFYGGRELEKSHANLAEYFARPAFKRVRRVAVIDVTTGLGDDPGMDTLVVNGREQYSILRRLFLDTHEDWQLEVYQDPRSKAGGGVYQNVMPGTTCHYSRLFPKADALELTQNFATISPELALRALREENAAFQGKTDMKFWAAASAQCRAAYYVRTRAWKTRVLHQGRVVIDRVTACLMT